MINQPAAESPRFLSIQEVARRTDFGKSTVLSWESQGKFPRAIRLSATKRVWLEADINAWILEQHKRALQSQARAA